MKRWATEASFQPWVVFLPATVLLSDGCWDKSCRHYLHESRSTRAHFVPYKITHDGSDWLLVCEWRSDEQTHKSLIVAEQRNIRDFGEMMTKLRVWKPTCTGKQQGKVFCVDQLFNSCSQALRCQWGDEWSVKIFHRKHSVNAEIHTCLRVKSVELIRISFSINKLRLMFQILAYHTENRFSETEISHLILLGNKNSPTGRHLSTVLYYRHGSAL